MSDNVNASEKLKTLVGFDPSKREPLSSELFNDALQKFRDKRLDEAKEQAENLISEAILLQEEFSKEEKAFKSKREKFEKTLGKLLNKIESGLSPASQSPQTETEALAEAQNIVETFDSKA